MHILTISCLKQVSNTFYFTFTVRPEAKATKNGFRIRNVVPATEEEARRILERKDAQALLSTAVVSK
jgi:acyl-coenzyme A thioesterase 9